MTPTTSVRPDVYVTEAARVGVIFHRGRQKERCEHQDARHDERETEAEVVHGHASGERENDPRDAAKGVLDPHVQSRVPLGTTRDSIAVTQGKTNAVPSGISVSATSSVR